MPTINQLVRFGRDKKIKKSKSSLMKNTRNKSTTLLTKQEKTFKKQLMKIN
jgi:ribosomal protein S12